MTPREATSHKKILTLNEDNYPPDPSKWSILLSADHVSLHQPDGGFVQVPRKDFNAIVDWYQRDQKLQDAAAD